MLEADWKNVSVGDILFHKVTNWRGQITDIHSCGTGYNCADVYLKSLVSKKMPRLGVFGELKEGQDFQLHTSNSPLWDESVVIKRDASNLKEIEKLDIKPPWDYMEAMGL